MSKLTSTSVLTSGAMKMPVIGLGTWQAGGDEIEKAVDHALSVGYRHLDTAYVYQNEESIGKVLKKWLSSGKIKREDLFITTKLPNTHNAAELVESVLKKQLEWLNLDYVDLYLIHLPIRFKQDDTNPLPKDEQGNIIREPVDLISLWKAMEAQVDAGRAKSIGLSNFNSKQIANIVENARIKPANLQVELHVYLQQKELAKFCSQHGITICGYAPLGSPGSKTFFKAVSNGETELQNLNPLEEPVVQKIAATHKKTPSQVLLRFLLQEGFAVIPKSSNPQRIEQNLQVFDFELSDQEVDTLRALDKGSSGRIFDFLFFPGVEKDENYPFNIPF
ncbi:unnamed protein product [Bemisia tabaci]|nr:unnamed protein product [Bemisia tabaci]